MDKRELSLWCYTIAQWNKLRLAYHRDNNIPFTEDDRIFTNGRGGIPAHPLASVGEHLAAVDTAASRIGGLVEYAVRSVLTDADNFDKPGALGFYIERIRVEALAHLSARGKESPDMIAALVESLASHGIYLDLDAPLNETGKP